MLRPLVVLIALAAFAVACSDTEPSVPADAGADVVDATACDGGFVCGGTCVDTRVDDAHCGGCDQACGADEVCDDGRCACPEGTERCGTACVDTATSTANCGTCGVRCGAGERCDDGECAIACEEGLTACDVGCVDTTSEEDHCGACDRPCAGGEHQLAECVDSECVIRCADDWYDHDDERGCEYFCAPDLPGAEVCDGQDNDCDGLVDTDDPGYEAPLCPLQLGVCAGASPSCVGGEIEPCDELLYATHAAEADADATYWADFEIRCDGRDDDCSGEADEDCCDAEDFPLTAPELPLPLGWTNYSTIRAIPLRGAPAPLVVELAIGLVGETPSVAINLLRFPPEGGAGRSIALTEDEFTVPRSSPQLLDAVWNDAVVVYTSDPDGLVTRTEYELDGTERDSVALTSVFEAVGGCEEVRARVDTDGNEVLLLMSPGSGDASVLVVTAAVFNPDETRAIVAPASFAGVRDARPLDIVPFRSGYLACYLGPSLSPTVECTRLDTELVASSRAQFDGGISELGELRFVPHPAGGFVAYMTDSDGEEIFEVRVTEEGVVTATATGFSSVSSFAMTGVLPTGEIGLMTGQAAPDEPEGTLLVTALVPGRSGAVVTRIQGLDVLPYGFLSGPDASFVLVRTRLPIGEGGGSARLFAFRLSQEGRALCLEAE